MVRDDDPAVALAGLRGRRAAANEPGSQSGCNALRAAVAPLARDGRFFGDVVWTGAHQASLAAVRDGAADVAAVDAVTFALLARHAALEVEGLRVLAWSEAAPALPYAASRGIGSDTRARLTAALLRALADPDAAEARAALLLEGLSPTDDAAYSVIPAMRRDAERRGYPELA
jgi:ABC-type phosphate/phosphonate transport system substrate-binding protein